MLRGSVARHPRLLAPGTTAVWPTAYNRGDGTFDVSEKSIAAAIGKGGRCRVRGL
jgi:hypothetical protein